MKVTLDVAGLRAEDVGVELVVAQKKDDKFKVINTEEFKVMSVEGNKATYELEVASEIPGALQLAIRIFPKNALLPHRQDFALVKWL